MILHYAFALTFRLIYYSMIKVANIMYGIILFSY